LKKTENGVLLEGTVGQIKKQHIYMPWELSSMESQFGGAG
jgi:hypothetical protein